MKIRLICLLGAIFSFLFVMKDVLYGLDSFRSIYNESTTFWIITFEMIVILNFIFLTIYLYKRRYYMVFAIWILSGLVHTWHTLDLLSTDWSSLRYNANYEVFIFKQKIVYAVDGLVSVAILVSEARKRIALSIFAVISLIVVLLLSKDWISIYNFQTIKKYLIYLPSLLVINYVLEYLKYKPKATGSTLKVRDDMLEI